LIEPRSSAAARPVFDYSLALLSVGLAFLARFALDPLLHERSPFIIFVVSVLVAAGFGGRGPGIVALLLSLLVGLFAFVEPRKVLAVQGVSAAVNIAAFLVVGTAVIVLIERIRSTRQAHAHAEERYQRLVASVEDYAVFSLDEAGRVATWNPGAERLKGWRVEEILGQHFSILYPEDLRREGRPERNLNIVRREGRHEEEGPRLRKDGGLFDAHVVITRLLSPGGEPEGFAKVVRDVTARRRAEARLAAEQAQFRAIFDTAVDAIAVIDERGVIQAFNSAAEAVFGYAAAEAIGRDISMLMPVDHGGRHGDYVGRYLRTGQARIIGTGRELEGRRRDGSTFPLELSIAEWRDVEGRRFFTGIMRDISERRRAEARLAETEARWRGLFDRMHEGFMLCEAVRDGSGAVRDFRFLEVNPAWEALTGLPPGAVLGRLASEAIPGLEPFWAETYARVVETGEPARFEHHAAPLGRSYEVHAFRADPDRFAALLLDVTARKASEAALREREARFRSLFTAIDEGYCLAEIVLDHGGRPVDYRFLEANAQFEAMTGLRDAVGRTALDLVPGLERHWIETYARVALGGEPIRFEQESGAMGRVFDVFATPVEPRGRFAIVFRDVTERRRAEGALTENEARFRAMADNIPQLAWMARPDGWIFWYNRRWFDYTGTTLEEMQGWGWTAVHHPDHLARVTERFRQAFAAGTPWEDTFPLRAADGGWRWFLSRAEPIRDGDGAITMWFGTNTDITEARAAEAALRESEARLRATVTSAPFPVNLHAEDGEILQLSGAFQEISGWCWPEDFRTIAEWAELAFGERKEAVQATIARLYELDRRVEEGEFKVRTRSGEERIWSFASAPVGRDARGRRLVVSMAADVTDLRRAEAARDAAFAQQQAVYANAPVGLAAHDRELRFLAINPRLAAINGPPVEAHLGRTPQEAIPELAPMVEPIIRRVLDTGQPVNEIEFEMETAAHPGERRHYLASYYPVRGAGDGAVEGVSIAVLDIDARKRAETALRELTATLERRVEERTQSLQETVAELEAFAYTVSHDLRAPLRGMEGFAQALLEDYPEELGPEGRRYAERITAAARRMDELIGDLLEYSRLSRADVSLRPMDPVPAIEGALADIRGAVEARGAQVTVAAPVPEVTASPPVLRQVMANLLGNAVKFVPGGETPQICVWAESTGKPGQGTPCVRIWVEDNGIGIAPEHRQRIFRVFERLHADSVYPGTGIGLAIVRRGAERMGGSAGVEDRPDGARGSRFWIELPAAT
jgi:PAS domain S-box-containing protein